MPIRMRVFAEDELLPEQLCEQLRGMFRRSYFSYPYLSAVGSPGQVRVVAWADGEPAGYAAFRAAHGYACCSSLLVEPEHRGLGLGRRIDHARFAVIRRRGLNGYVSCLCEDTASQRLKVELGLRPVNVKYGHQTSFVREDQIGTALVFSEGALAVTVPSREDLDVNRDLARVRMVTADPRMVQTAAARWPDSYVEALTGPDQAAELSASPRLAYAGVDLDKATGRWHHCFQAVNGVYRRGLSARPKFVAEWPDHLAGLCPF